MEPSRITAEELRRRMDRGERPVVIDARSADAWSKATSQAAGSVRVPPDDVAAHVDEIPKGRPIVAYCTGPQEHSSARVARELADRGLRDVYALKGGFDAWRRAGLPLEAPEPTNIAPS